MNRKIITDDSMRELNEHGDYTFPLGLLHIKQQDYPFGRLPCHWHPEIELIMITKGSVIYQINQISYTLRENDCIFINSNVLHTAETDGKSECHYTSIDFDPLFLYGYEHSIIKDEYITPIISSNKLPCIIFRHASYSHVKMTDLIKKIDNAYVNKNKNYHLEIKIWLSEIWLLICQEFDERPEKLLEAYDSDQMDKIKEALNFIYSNFSSQISLDNMAHSCHLSKSEFSRLFKKIFHTTPFMYLQYYRIQKSLPLLKDTNYSITEISELVGFSGPSYFTETFRKSVGETPTQYRKKIIG